MGGRRVYLCLAIQCKGGPQSWMQGAEVAVLDNVAMLVALFDALPAIRGSMIASDSLKALDSNKLQLVSSAWRAVAGTRRESTRQSSDDDIHDALWVGPVASN